MRCVVIPKVDVSAGSLQYVSREPQSQPGPGTPFGSKERFEETGTRLRRYAFPIIGHDDPDSRLPRCRIRLSGGAQQQVTPVAHGVNGIGNQVYQHLPKFAHGKQGKFGEAPPHDKLPPRWALALLSSGVPMRVAIGNLATEWKDLEEFGSWVRNPGGRFTGSQKKRRFARDHFRVLYFRWKQPALCKP